MDGEEPRPRLGVRVRCLDQAAHRPDQREGIGTRDVLAHRARGHRAPGEFVDRLADPAPGGGVPAAPEKQARVPRVVGEGLADGPQQLLQAPAVGARQRLFGGAQHFLGGKPQQLVDQGVLAGEAAVDGADADAGPGGDLLHRGVGARLAEDLTGRCHDPVVVADGVAPGDRVTEAVQAAHRASRSSPVSITGGVRAWMRTYPLDSPSAVWLVGTIPARAGSVPGGRWRAAGMSRPASAASTSPAAIIANPIV